jgi:hypothetical protein
MRRLKILNIFSMEIKKQKTPRNIRLCRSQRRVNKAPVLTLEGLWLQELGFDISDLVQITPGNEELIIKIIEKWK